MESVDASRRLPSSTQPTDDDEEVSGSAAACEDGAERRVVGDLLAQVAGPLAEEPAVEETAEIGGALSSDTAEPAAERLAEPGGPNHRELDEKDADDEETEPPVDAADTAEKARTANKANTPSMPTRGTKAAITLEVEK